MIHACERGYRSDSDIRRNVVFVIGVGVAPVGVTMAFGAQPPHYAREVTIALPLSDLILSNPGHAW